MTSSKYILHGLNLSDGQFRKNHPSISKPGISGCENFKI